MTRCRPDDVEFTCDCVSPMLEFLSENPEVGMVGPQMLTVDGNVSRSTMRFPTVWNQFSRSLGLDILFKKSRFFGGLLMAEFDHKSTVPVEVLNGWFVIVRRTAMEQVGLLDPQFFMYGEDMDWCYRFHRAAQKTVFFADTGAIHYGGASSSNAPLRFYVEMFRANWQYWRKHRGWLAQRAFLASSVTYHLVRLAGSVVLYITSPSKRADNLAKLRRSFLCLKGMSQPSAIQSKPAYPVDTRISSEA